MRHLIPVVLLSCAGPALALPASVADSVAAAAATGPQVHCTADYALWQIQLTATPTRDPFDVKDADLFGRFRVALQLLAPANKVKTWVYHSTAEKQVLVQAAEYPLGESCRGQRDLGTQRIYAGTMERELLLQCRATCSQD